MTAFLVKIGDSAKPPSYTTIAGMRSTKREAIGDITGTGVFTGESAHDIIDGAAKSGSILPLEFSFETGERESGKYLVLDIASAGFINGEPQYTVEFYAVGNVEQVQP